ncbi:inactive leucine-rich repeat receptor-like protein kinase CORYNE [Andrographis paniculata]|uniref:inactive leucine-rich repeat receptor-like protein kinase CORYNE n=1 Tax=Andrographis paniculata TaxID=175694 RepID=UPI0021E7DA06|nr:inactive leucine-rich repeat receptor-like protein kinase CORYNE [Andrographis paniculata]
MKTMMRDNNTSIRTRMKVLTMAVLLLLCLKMAFAECRDGVAKNQAEETTTSSFKNRRLKKICLSIGLGILTGLISALLFAIFLRHFVRFINKSPTLKSPILFSPKISPKTLKSALSNNPQLLGTNPSSTYYKAVLDNGLVVAVKRLDGGGADRAARRRMLQELEAIKGLRHRNLMSLRAYVCDSNGCSLVYDYAGAGSLEDAVRRGGADGLAALNWEARLRIAVGIVKALHYLHFSCDPPRLHLNLKPSNVMLDSELEPRLADCGLAAISPDFRRPASGYNPPECFQNCRYTDKSDVYSFGVILGELLTGRDPMGPFVGETSSGGSLGQWLRHVQQAGEAREALDKSILGEESEEEEILMAMRIAGVCLSDLPADRPSSDELVSMLTQLNSF